MHRVIKLLNKSTGNTVYVCDGSGCDLCSGRFKCFTFGHGVLYLNWAMIKTDKSPSVFLMGVTHSKIYVRGSKRFISLAGNDFPMMARGLW